MRQTWLYRCPSTYRKTTRNLGSLSTGMGLLFSVCLVLSILVWGSGQSGSRDRTAGDAVPGPKIQHVVMIFQENRTPDNLFHGLPNADIANSGVNSHGRMIQLTPMPLTANYDLGHSHTAFLAMFDGGKMDGADKVGVGCLTHKNCPPPNPQFVYVPASEARPYLQMAEQYTFADRMFQTNQGPSFPAHQFIIAGTSAPTASSDLFAAENPYRKGGDAFGNGGCNAAAGTTVA